MAATPPIGERRWRTLVALLLAPASLAPVALLEYLDYEDEGVASTFFPFIFLAIVAAGYVGSAITGAIASTLRIGFRAPLKASVIASLFALSAGLWGLFVPGTLAERLFTTALLAVLSLPVSLSYCAIAGIKWR